MSAVANTAASTAAHAATSSPSFFAQAAGMVVALVLVLLLAWVLLALLKRFQVGRSSAGVGSAQVLGTVALGPRERVVTLRWQGRDYLLGVTPAAIQLIDQRESPAAQAVVTPEPSQPAQPAQPIS
jgi:flagellar protein FliO/FliZ